MIEALAILFGYLILAILALGVLCIVGVFFIPLLHMFTRDEPNKNKNVGDEFWHVDSTWRDD